MGNKQLLPAPSPPFLEPEMSLPTCSGSLAPVPCWRGWRAGWQIKRPSVVMKEQRVVFLKISFLQSSWRKSRSSPSCFLRDVLSSRTKNWPGQQDLCSGQEAELAPQAPGSKLVSHHLGSVGVIPSPERPAVLSGTSSGQSVGLSGVPPLQLAPLSALQD